MIESWREKVVMVMMDDKEREDVDGRWT